MTEGVAHLTVEELEERFRTATDVIERSHCQVVWLLAKGHTKAEVAELVALSPRWVNKLVHRYQQQGANALGDRRRRNSGAKPLLSHEDLEALRQRLAMPPDDGGLWSGPKVARWIAERLGLKHVHAPRGWEALKRLGWSIQTPRPKNPKAVPEAQAAFKKSWSRQWQKRPPSTPARQSRSGLRTSTGSA